MKTYQGACHCGAVAFSFRSPEIQSAMRCDCSICSRKGITMSADVIPFNDMTIERGGDMLNTHQFGTMRARHHFCRVCGVHAFVEIMRAEECYRINLGCVDALDALRLPYEIFEGRRL
ncbi:MAG: GFA family protein [Pseudomonadota bacterium]